MKHLSIVGVLLALMLSACGSSKLKQSASTPEVKKDVATTEALVKGCVAKNHSRKAILNCIAPKGHTKALEQCVVSAVAHDVLIHKSRLIGDTTKCVEANR